MAFVHAAMKVGKTFTFTLDTSDPGYRSLRLQNPACSASRELLRVDRPHATGHEHDEAAMISGGCQLDCAHAAT